MSQEKCSKCGLEFVSIGAGSSLCPDCLKKDRIERNIENARRLDNISHSSNNPELILIKFISEIRNDIKELLKIISAHIKSKK
jgi:hypothetical protein